MGSPAPSPRDLPVAKAAVLLRLCLCERGPRFEARLPVSEGRAWVGLKSPFSDYTG